ncbi:hypothetical protein F4802DRAFT_598576 [Xylaria palmicola]|nr:hypothetical protein F4802DRAFT_598576 [Xylaria palmicola]
MEIDQAKAIVASQTTEVRRTENNIESDAGSEKAQTMCVDAREPSSAQPEKLVGRMAAAKVQPNKSLLPSGQVRIKREKTSKVAGGSKGSKPTGVVKRTSPKAPKEGGKDPSLGQMLAGARKWLVAPASYIIRNPETGCFGLSCRHDPGERAEITIAHGEDCECLDARLLHIAQHADQVVKAGHLTRRFRDAFVMAIKIRLTLPHPVPAGARFPPLRRTRAIRRPQEEVDAEEAVINVTDEHNNQKLVEKWKSLRAYKKRPIWKDW